MVAYRTLALSRNPYPYLEGVEHGLASELRKGPSAPSHLQGSLTPQEFRELTLRLTDLAHARRELLFALCWGEARCLRGASVVLHGTTWYIGLDRARIRARVSRPGVRAVVLLHNHPAGDPSPSTADVASTAMLSQFLASVGVRLVDHIVVTPRAAASIRFGSFWTPG